MKGCALAWQAVKPDLATLHFYQGFGDVQPKSRTGNVSHILVISPEEFLEYFWFDFPG